MTACYEFVKTIGP